MNPIIKMLALDIDGTIYNKNFECSVAVKECITTLIEKGVKVVLATGRMYCSAVPVARELNLDTPIICYQGALVRNFRENNETLLNISTDETLAREIIDCLRSQNIHTNVYIKDDLIVENDGAEIRHYITQRNISYRVVESFDGVDLMDLNKILAITTDESKTVELVRDLSPRYERLCIVRSMPHFCEFSNKDATKGNAIEFLAKKWGIKKEEVMAVGDQDNDIDMLKSAGIGVAMGNATQELKNIADFITGSINEDGLITAVKKYMGESYGL